MSVNTFVTPSAAQALRYPSIDIARGIIMIVMALDHASVAWNSGRAMPEVVGLGPVDYGHWTQQVTREITHICAPGFQLLAGMGLAISVWRRQRAGQSELFISADMVLRGLALLFCDFVLMYYAYDRVPFFFLVLACIGSCTILFAALRKLPLSLILLFAIAVVFGGPLYAKGHIVAPTASGYLYNIFVNVALPTEWPAPPDQRAFFVLYPILPWIGCFALGWFLGTILELSAHGGGSTTSDSLQREASRADNRSLALDVAARRQGQAAATRNEPTPPEAPRTSAGVFAWLGPLGIALGVAAFLMRWFAGAYADPHPLGDGPSSAAFWTLSKYPPSPVFLTATAGVMLVLLSLLRRLDQPSLRSRSSVGVSVPWRVPLVFGNVSLFFFVVHMYVYFSYPFVSGTAKTYSLGTTYVVWLGGLVVTFPLCVGYAKLRRRYRTVLRYF